MLRLRRTPGISESMRGFLDYKSIDCRERTVVRISDALKSFLRYAETANLKRIGRIRPRHIMDWQSWRVKRSVVGCTGQSPAIRTVNTELIMIRQWCAWLTLRGDLTVNPATQIKKLRVPESAERKALSRDEWLRFERASLELELRPKGRGMGLQYPARRGQTRVFRFLLCTGLRIQELTHLEWSDVERDGIKIQKKKDWNPKTYGRLVPFNESSRKVLDEIRRERSGLTGLVFLDYRGRPLKPARVRRWILAVAESCNPPIERVTGPHTFRHTFITNMVESGADIDVLQEIVGHKDLSVTRGYIHTSLERKSRQMEMASVG